MKEQKTMLYEEVKHTPGSDPAKWSAVADMYHAHFTGSVLTVVTRAGAAAGAEMVFELFRRQHHEKFLSSLDKLGLTGKPHPVIAAQYHYLSNAIGGVTVEYYEESAKKAWVRYPTPRWAWFGTAVCGVPGEVSRAMLRGWHGNNGVSLNNLRMGFVCTKQTMDGQPGLEGYYYEADHELAPEDRVRFERGLEMPWPDPDKQPTVPTEGWPVERLQKARRNYAMEFARTGLPALVAIRGPQEGAYLGGYTSRLVGMQYYGHVTRAFDLPSQGDAVAFGKFMVEMAIAQGDQAEMSVETDGVYVRQNTWKIMKGLLSLHPAVFDAWNELWVGCLAAHNRRLALMVTKRLDYGDGAFEWRITTRKGV